MEDYNGFKLDYERGFITFYHPDKEDGSGDWSGFASTVEEAYEVIDQMLFEQ
jgi:hypothetical protein